MVNRPHQQASRPDPARRDSRSRSFAAAAVGLSSVILVALALLLAPRGNEPTLGAEGPVGRTPLTGVAQGQRPATPLVAALVDALPRVAPFRWPDAQRVAIVRASLEPIASTALVGDAAPVASGVNPPGVASIEPASSSPASASAPAAPLASAPASPLPSIDPSPTPMTPAPTLLPGAKPPAAPPTSAEPEDLKGYTWPLYQGRMTNFFGPRDDGFLVVDGQRIHPGLDTTTFCGDTVRAAHAGVVVAVGRRFADTIGFGGPLDDFYRKIRRRHSLYMQPIVVVVDDGNGYRSMYVHLEKALVKVGDTVRRRMAIGLEGRTGNANGCHVHYELIRMDGPWMRVANDLVKQYGYPAWERERVDPLRVLNLHVQRAGKFVPGILRPHLSASLRPSRSPTP